MSETFDPDRADIAMALSNLSLAVQHLSIAILAAYKRDAQDMLAKLEVVNDAVDRVMEATGHLFPVSDNDDDPTP